MIHWNLIATFILRNVLWFLLQLIDHEVHESNEVLGGGLGLGLGGSGLWPGGPSLAESPGADLHLSSPHPISVPPEPGMGKWGPGQGLGSSTNLTPDFGLSYSPPHHVNSAPPKDPLGKRRLKLISVKLYLT